MLASNTLLSIDGEIVPTEKAGVHALTPTIKFALMVFETLRGYRGGAGEALHLFRLDDHLARLRRSADLLHIAELPPAATLRRWLVDLVDASGLREDCALRIQAQVETPDGRIWSEGPVRIVMTVRPCGPSVQAETGVRCRVSDWRRSPAAAMPPRAKCAANYLTSRLALLQAREEGLDGAILLNARGLVAEGPLASIFLLRDGVPVTPDLASDILDGITRDSLIRLLADAEGPAVVERAVERAELGLAEEAFFCSTGMEVTPIVEIDGKPLGDGRPGPLTRSLRARYLALVRGEVPDDGYDSWRTPT